MMLHYRFRTRARKYGGRENMNDMRNSTQIKGDADWQPCLTKAAMLIMDIYNYEDKELTDDLQAEKARLWDYWERGWHEDLESGMFCRMYYPKITGNLTPLDVCPPVLVFRGSEMHAADIEELAVHIELDCTISASGLPGIFMDTTHFSPTIPVLAPSENISPSASRADLRKAGLLEQPLIKQASGSEVIRFSSLGIGMGSITIDWVGSASLFYGRKGDWPTNIAQGIGEEVPPQYIEAIEIAATAASEAMINWNGRLLIVGHSLGGGLAACAALAAKKAEPDLALKCNTYNAAGLHDKTAERAGLSRSEAASAGVAAYCVKSDILTSIQTPGLVPLFSDILRWAEVELPSSVPTSAPTFGYSPGGEPGMMFTHFERAKKWHSLPFLFPLRTQNLVDGDLKTIEKVFMAASNAQDFSRFVSNILSMLFLELGDDNGAIRSWHMYDFYKAQNMLATQFKLSGKEMLAGINQPPRLKNFPEVNFGDSAYMRNQVHPFINGLLRDCTELGQIMQASVDYHMWDACAYTFLLVPPKGTFRYKEP